jgi:hypothetical protein
VIGKYAWVGVTNDGVVVVEVEVEIEVCGRNSLGTCDEPNTSVKLMQTMRARAMA